MKTKFNCIFLKNANAHFAYVLKSGYLIIELNIDNYFKLSSNNLIFGAMEILISQADSINCTRAFNIKTSKDSKYLQIPAERILQLVKTYNIGFAIAKGIAQTLVEVNKILTAKQKEIEKKEKASQEYCKIFTWATNILTKHYQEKRFPWLANLVKDLKSSLTYHKGLAFSTNDYESKLEITETVLDKFNKIFPSGSILCNQGDDADELFILQKGKLQVYINNNSIASIEEPGCVIGEMALLMGEKRNATMKSVQETIVTIIKKNNLKKFAEEHPDFLKNIAINLTRRVLQNCEKLENLNEFIKQNNKENSSIPTILQDNRYKEEVKNLKSSVKQLYDKYNIEWLYDIVSEITDKIIKTKVK